MILELFLVNNQYDNHFDPIDLLTMSLTCKDIRSLVINKLQRHKQEDIAYHKTLLHSHINDNTTEICSFCKHNETKQHNACYSCFYEKYICKTQAKNKYKLKNKDLELINSIDIWIPKYYTMANYFLVDDVKRLALLTHKSLSLSFNNLSKAYLDRQSKLNNLYQKLGITENDIPNEKYTYIIFPYKRNGAGGIKTVTKGLALWDSFTDDCLQQIAHKECLYESEIKQIRILYTNGMLDKQLAIEELKGIAYRRHKLLKELERRNINVVGNLLDYVYVCVEYVTYGNFSITEAVNEALIEVFFKEVLDIEHTDFIHNIRDIHNIDRSNMSILNLESMINEEILNTKLNKLNEWINQNSYEALPKYIKDWYEKLV